MEEEKKLCKRKSIVLEDTQEQNVENPRKIQQLQFSHNQEVDHNDNLPFPQRPLLLGFNRDLNLCLSLSSSPNLTIINPTPPPPPLLPPNPVFDVVVTPSDIAPPMTPSSPSPEPLVVTNNNSTTTNVVSTTGSTSRRGRRASTSSLRSRSEGGGARPILKTNPITPPFRWATNRRATVQSMQYLMSQGIHTVTGDVQCKKCERSYEMEYNVEEKFRELVFFVLNQEDMRQRAPKAWLEPKLPMCKFCGEEDSCKPLISEKKKSINWLFLLLGQLLGCCTLEQLKYFCKHTINHRTGAKDRVLFLSYFTLCKQLDPEVPFIF